MNLEKLTYGKQMLDILDESNYSLLESIYKEEVKSGKELVEWKLTFSDKIENLLLVKFKFRDSEYTYFTEIGRIYL
jgi:hypothetical protein